MKYHYTETAITLTLLVLIIIDLYYQHGTMPVCTTIIVMLYEPGEVTVFSLKTEMSQGR
jgi:hypothetical protein